MTKNIKYLTRNAKLVCAADFFWNLGRNFPHAILTIFLLEQGFDLVRIATLQSVFTQHFQELKICGHGTILALS